MAVAVDIEHLKGILKCSICLGKYNNPKILSCTHHFCKTCLEDIVVFRSDGSAVINCPMRCTKETVIEKDKTIDDLAASFDFKNILDALKSDDEEDEGLNQPTCKYILNCRNFVSVYCCGALMCNACNTEHNSNTCQSKKKISAALLGKSPSKQWNVYFCKKDARLKVVCDKHFSRCTHFCSCEKFLLCMYCVNRDKFHANNHNMKTINTIVSSLKEKLVKDSKDKEKLMQCQTSTETGIATYKEELESLLQKRKEECLTQYKEFVEQEEKRLKEKFHKLCDDHIQIFRRDHNPDYYEEELAKTDVELALQAKEILQKTFKNSNKLLHQTVRISTSHYCNAHPLGELKVFSHEEAVSAPTATLKFEVESGKAGPSTPSRKEDRNICLTRSTSEKGRDSKSDGASSLNIHITSPPTCPVFSGGVLRAEDDGGQGTSGRQGSTTRDDEHSYVRLSIGDKRKKKKSKQKRKDRKRKRWGLLSSPSTTSSQSSYSSDSSTDYSSSDEW